MSAPDCELGPKTPAPVRLPVQPSCRLAALFGHLTGTLKGTMADWK
jgi:hypothetical protein